MQKDILGRGQNNLRRSDFNHCIIPIYPFYNHFQYVLNIFEDFIDNFNWPHYLAPSYISDFLVPYEPVYTLGSLGSGLLSRRIGRVSLKKLAESVILNT